MIARVQKQKINICLRIVAECINFEQLAVISIPNAAMGEENISNFERENIDTTAFFEFRNELSFQNKIGGKHCTDRRNKNAEY